MSISHYLKDIGRGKDGARPLTREQAADLFTQLLDGQVTALETGAFCMAMRIKGETPEEMAGFLDATHARRHPVPTTAGTTVVLPSYNGARKLPVLTPLLALLLAREGCGVLVHGASTESSRVSALQVLQILGVPSSAAIEEVASGQIRVMAPGLLCPGLGHLLDVRRVVGLRNSAHSLVKMLNPCSGPAVVVASYTHPEYAVSMTATLRLTRTPALLLRGTEGEPVADARRTPAMDVLLNGEALRVQEAQAGPLASMPQLPAPDAHSTAHWIAAVLDGQIPVPAPIALQVAHILLLCRESLKRTP